MTGIPGVKDVLGEIGSTVRRYKNNIYSDPIGFFQMVNPDNISPEIVSILPKDYISRINAMSVNSRVKLND
jgi:hypothetical protein